MKGRRGRRRRRKRRRRKTGRRGRKTGSGVWQLRAKLTKPKTRGEDTRGQRHKAVKTLEG